ncbi:MAG: hypothetical protein ACRC6T_17695 [Sarcina sp.]
MQTTLYHKKTAQNPNDTVILSKGNNQKETSKVMHNNKMVKIDGVNLTNIRSFKNSNYFIGFVNINESAGTTACYLGNYDGIVKELFKGNVATQIIKVTKNYVYIQNDKDLISINLKDGTEKIINSNYASYNIKAISGDDVMFSRCNNSGNDKSYFVYNTKTNKSIDISKLDSTIGGEVTAINDGFVIVGNEHKLSYYNIQTGKITNDKKSVMPKSFEGMAKSNMNGFTGMLSASFNKITYLYTENNSLYLITKEKNKEPKILATLSNSDNYSRNYLSNSTMGTGSHKYFYYEDSNSNLYSINLETDKKVQLNNKDLNLSSTRFTKSGDAYVLTTSPKAVRVHEPMAMYTYPNSELYFVNSKTGELKLNSKNVCYFDLTNGNLTTLDYITSKTNQNLTTQAAYNINFNGKKIVKDAPFVSNDGGSFLYQDSNGKLYTLYNGISTQLDIPNVYNYSSIMQYSGDIGIQGLGNLKPNINGYFKGVKGGVITYYKVSNHNIIKVIDSKNPSYKAMEFNPNINEKTGGINSSAVINPLVKYEPKTINFDVVNYTEVKFNNEIFKRVAANEYIAAQTKAIKAQGAKELAVTELHTNNIVTKEVKIDGETYTKAYAVNNESINATYYVASDGFIYQYANKPDGTKILLPAMFS